MQKCYKIISIINAVINGLMLIGVLIAAFLPYFKEGNYYRSFKGFFGNPIVPYCLMLLPMAIFVLNILSIREPLMTVWGLIISLIFFAIIAFPLVLVLAFGGTDEGYGIGFRFLMAISYVVYWQTAFAFYAVVYKVYRISHSK